MYVMCVCVCDVCLCGVCMCVWCVCECVCVCGVCVCVWCVCVCGVCLWKHRAFRGKNGLQRKLEFGA